MAEREKAAKRTGKLDVWLRGWMTLDNWGKVKDGKDGDGNTKK